MQPPAGSQTSRVPAQRNPPAAPDTEPPAGTPGTVPPVEPGAVPTGTAPEATTGTEPAAPPAAPRRSQKQILLAVLGGVFALMVMAAGTLAYLYDRATTPDRSAPDVVVDNYLRAYLVDRNDVLAQQFLCATTTDLISVQALRAEVERRETEFKVVVRVSWGALMRTRTNAGETVRTTLTIRSFADGQDRAGRREDWAFDVSSDDGWRVCAARKES